MTQLDIAMATLVQNQAAFAARVSETDRLHAQLERETAESFAHIKAQMAEIIRVLAEHGRLLERLPEVIRVQAEHSRLLERLPEAVREKIGFKAPQ